MSAPARIAVLASGGGTNLQALLDTFNANDSALARVALVVSDRKGAGALERAAAAGVDARVVAVHGRKAAESAGELLETLERARIDVVALAGYLRLVPAAVVARFRDRIVNVHPALLPAFGGPGFYGARVHRAVLDAGCHVSGATVHLVDEEYDRGHILAQWPVPVLAGDTAETLAARVLRAEHVLFPAALELLVRGFGAGMGSAVAATDPGAYDPSEGAPTDTAAYDLTADAAPHAAAVRRALGLPPTPDS